jgi:hypothetical protein
MDYSKATTQKARFTGNDVLKIVITGKPGF